MPEKENTRYLVVIIDDTGERIHKTDVTGNTDTRILERFHKLNDQYSESVTVYDTGTDELPPEPNMDALIADAVAESELPPITLSIKNTNQCPFSHVSQTHDGPRSSCCHPGKRVNCEELFIPNNCPMRETPVLVKVLS